jgi:hypothetical protein
MVVLGAASPAGATTGAQTYQYDCTLSSPLGSQVMPLAVTFAGNASDHAADGSPDTVSHNGSVDVGTTVAATVAGPVLAAAQAQVGALVPGATITGVALTVDSISTSVANGNPSSFSASSLAGANQAPDFTNGNTFTFPAALVGSTAATGFVQGGADEITAFSGGPATISVTLTINPLGPNALTGLGCVINNQDGDVDSGEASAPAPAPAGTPLELGLATPGTPYAGVTQVNSAPVLSNGTHLNAVAGVPGNLTIAGTDADGDNLTGWSVSSASCTDAASTPVALTPAGTTPLTASYGFSPPLNAANYSCTFTANVNDTPGLAATPAIFTVDVAAGDQTAQDVTLQLDPGVLDLQQAGGSINLGSYTLTGVNHTMPDVPINRLTISDGRGVPAPWNLTAQLAGPMTNPAFPGDPNSSIPASRMTIQDMTCSRTAVGGVGNQPTAQSPGTLDNKVSICKAVSGSNTGQFIADADLILVVPGNTYAGLYSGTINFIVA